MGDWYDPLFKLRYGVDSTEKYRQALGGQIPGAEPIHSDEDLAREERRTSGYLFGKQHPSVARFGTEVANTIRFWEPQALHQTATDATSRGIADAGRMKPDHPALSSWDAARAHFFGGD